MSEPELDPDQFEEENPYGFPLVPRFYLEKYNHLARPPQMPWDIEKTWYDTFLAYMTERDHFMVNILLHRHNEMRLSEGYAPEPKKYFLSRVLAAGCEAMFKEANIDFAAEAAEEAQRLESYCKINAGAVEEYRREKRKRHH